VLNRYPLWRMVMTCRNAVYKDEAADITDQKLEIAEFTDQQIRAFLRSWEPSFPEGKSTDELLLALQDRPRIMALARNPLLLTITAYLYSDQDFILPHSRAEFYDQSTDQLLRVWHTEQNQFQAAVKRLILQHLAVVFQNRSTHDH